MALQSAFVCRRHCAVRLVGRPNAEACQLAKIGALDSKVLVSRRAEGTLAAVTICPRQHAAQGRRQRVAVADHGKKIDHRRAHRLRVATAAAQPLEPDGLVRELPVSPEAEAKKCAAVHCECLGMLRSGRRMDIYGVRDEKRVGRRLHLRDLLQRYDLTAANSEKVAVEAPDAVYLPSGLFPIWPTKITLFILDFCNFPPI